MERNNRKVYTGTVVSTKMDKTITVLVETHVKHKLYGKRMKSSTKFHAHDEENASKRLEIKQLIKDLKKVNPFVEGNIFKSVENVNLKTIIAYKDEEGKHSFLEDYKKS